MPSFARLLRCCCLAGLVLLPGCVFITGNLNPFAAKPEPLEEHVVSGEGADKILLLDVSQTITSEDEEGTFGIKRREGTTARVQEELEQAAKDDHVRAVVLRINSPGGTVTASDIVYHQIMRFKAERHVPVVAQMLDMGTSGAYYVAVAADEIVASPTTVTGSIGVVMYGVNFSGLMEKLGVTNQTLKAGEHKDIGSPLRKMTAEEQDILQSVLADMHSRFLSVVRERRAGLSDDTARTIADGRILTADQALQAGLVDRIGYLPDALSAAKSRAGVTQARVVMYRRPEEFAENIYSTPPTGAPQMNLVNFDFGGLRHATPQFLYMWLPAAE
ncbi:MAG: signal peptide peptidase SppA [Candidatus Binatia bacterium]